MAFVPENELEAALVAAATSPEARPRFYELLAQSDLLIVDENPEPDQSLGPRVLEAGRSLPIRMLSIEGVPHTPVFSSPARISAVVQGQVRYLAINTRLLFETIGKNPAILNPGSDYGKQLAVEEMASVVDLAHVVDPESGDQPHTMIGIDADDGTDLERLVGEAGIIVRGAAKAGEFVDFIRITSGGVSDYMTKQTKPFYRRKLLGLL